MQTNAGISILLALPASYIALCIFSTVHDSIHESGHGVVCRARGSNVHISLGSYACFPPRCEDSIWSVVAHPQLFYRPIYRTSTTCCSYPCHDPGSASTEEPLLFMGGLFGLIGMWLICFVLACSALRFFPRSFPSIPPNPNSVGVLWTFYRAHIIIFIPDLWILRARWYPWCQWTMTLTCCFAQLDLLNEIFYTFTPAPNVLGEWQPFFDGVRQWLIWTGVSPGSPYAPAFSASVRNGLWAFLLLLYIVHTIRYLRLAALLLFNSLRDGVAEETLTDALHVEPLSDVEVDDSNLGREGTALSLDLPGRHYIGLPRNADSEELMPESWAAGCDAQRLDNRSISTDMTPLQAASASLAQAER
jgi:hypothetical protein